MTSTVQKQQPAATDPHEYLIAQLLMRWVLRRKDVLGIRYVTSKFDKATNELSINVILPTRTTNKSDWFCEGGRLAPNRRRSIHD